MDDPSGDRSREARSDDVTPDAARDDETRETATDEATTDAASADVTRPVASGDARRETGSDETPRDTASTDAASGESVAREPARPVRTVQAAAIDHAFAVGPPDAGLRLAGQLAVLDHENPGLATLAPLVATLVGRDDGRVASSFDHAPPRPSFPARTTTDTRDTIDDFAASDSANGASSDARRGERPTSEEAVPRGGRPPSMDIDAVHDPDPLVRGAAIAVARYDVPLARAADAADRPIDRVSRAARVRRPPDDHTSL